jgi:hypothetical protein
MSGPAGSAGGPHGHGSGSMSGAFDLLKQATQRMMSKDSPRYVETPLLFSCTLLLVHDHAHEPFIREPLGHNSVVDP